MCFVFLIENYEIMKQFLLERCNRNSLSHIMTNNQSSVRLPAKMIQRYQNITHFCLLCLLVAYIIILHIAVE